MAAKASNETANYVENEMPLAEARQWQAFYLMTREFSPVPLSYPQYIIEAEQKKEMEKILNG